MLRRVGEDFLATLGYKHSLKKKISSGHMMWNHDFESFGTGVLQDEGKLNFRFDQYVHELDDHIGPH